MAAANSADGSSARIRQVKICQARWIKPHRVREWISDGTFGAGRPQPGNDMLNLLSKAQQLITCMIKHTPYGRAST